MSYSYTVLQDAPVGFWPLTNSFAELTGRSGAGTNIDSENTKPVVAQSGGAQRVSGLGFTVPNSDIFTQGMESRPFTLEAWVKPEGTVGQIVLFGRGLSSITLDGRILTATVNMGTDLVITYAGIDNDCINYVALTYDPSSVTLYVDGVPVGSVVVTPDNLAAGFEAETDFSFSASAGAAYSIDSVAIYNQVLRNIDVARHYRVGTDYLDVLTLNANKFSTRFLFEDRYASVNTDKTFDSLVSWGLGNFTDAIVANDILTNVYDDALALYKDGIWQYSLHIEPQTTPLDSGRVTWEADDGVEFRWSEDKGTTWIDLTNDGFPIPVNYSVATGKDFIIQITLPGGPAQLSVSRLNITLYDSRSVQATNSNLLAVLNSSPSQRISEFDYEPSAFQEYDGYRSFGGNGRISFGPDTVFGAYEAIEFTIRTSGTTILSGDATVAQPGITVNGTGQWVASNLSALYVDGVTVSITNPVTLTPNSIHHVIATFPAFAGTFYLGDNSDLRVGYVALHYDAPSASEATAIYDAWVGTQPYRVVEAQTVNVTEHDLDSGPVNAYSYIWSSSSR